MQPFLDPGDEVAVDWSAGAPFRAGELILGRDPQAPSQPWVVHRVLAHTPSGILSKGDSAFAGETLPETQLWGRIIGVRRRARHRRARRFLTWRSPTQRRPHEAFRAGALDRIIARLSLLTLPPESPRARLARGLVRALGWARRLSP